MGAVVETGPEPIGSRMDHVVVVAVVDDVVVMVLLLMLLLLYTLWLTILKLPGSCIALRHF